MVEEYGQEKLNSNPGRKEERMVGRKEEEGRYRRGKKKEGRREV